MAIKLICLSDLHLGADHSILTELDGTQHASRSLSAFADAFSAMLEHLAITKNTRLVLLGDVLDLGFSSLPDVVASFRVFAETLLGSKGGRKLSHDILFVPGNHDHQLWQTVKNTYMVRQVVEGKTQDPREITHLFNPQHLESYLLRDILKTVPGARDYSVQIAYPNYAVLDDSGQKGVVLHHGHYTESMYLAMSGLRQRLQGRLSLSEDMSEIERDNGYWVNFLWSSLGSSGFGHTAFNMYETLLDTGASHEFIRASGKTIKKFMVNSLSLSDNTVQSIEPGLSLEKIIDAMLDASVGKFAGSERLSFGSVLSPDGISKLKWYLAGPVKQQFIQERVDVPKDLSFVFGHTHKPFEDRLPTPGFEEPVRVFNTGGWAIDKPVISSVQGAAAVFIDDDCDVGSLRLFNCSPNDAVAPPHIAGAGSLDDAERPLLRLLEDALARSAGDWATFSAAVNHDVQRNTSRVLDRYFDPTSETGVRIGRAV